MRVSFDHPKPRTINPASLAVRPDRGPDSLSSVMLILALAAAAMAALVSLLPETGHDQIWCLYAAEKMLHGTALYGPEMLETNPPLIFWITLLPVWLAEATGVAVTAVSKLLIVALVAAMGSLFLRLVLRGEAGRGAPGAGGAKLLFLGLAYGILGVVVPGLDLGQRDHLLILLCLPYLAAAALPLGRDAGVGVGFRGMLGLLAAVGIALKPHQVLMIVAVELVLVVDRRSARSLLRPELLALLAGGGVYVAVVRWLTPRYFDEVLPLLRETYWAFGSLSWADLVAASPELHLLGAAAFALFWFGRRAVKPPRTGLLTKIMLAAGTAATLAFYVQGTGWTYQQLPAMTLFGMALALMLVEHFERHPVRVPRWAPYGVGAGAAVALVLTAYGMGYGGVSGVRQEAVRTGPDAAFFAGLPEGTPVAVMTTKLDNAIVPIARFHLTLAQRSPHLWLLPAILRNESPAGAAPAHVIAPSRLAELDRLQHAMMAEDLVRWQPKLILIERCQEEEVRCQGLKGRQDDLLAWFERDAGFRAAFAPYASTGSRGGFEAYTRR